MCDHLRNFIQESTPAQLKLWVKKQSLIARAFRKGMRNRHGRQVVTNSVSIELPDEDAIVNETIARVLGSHEGYGWDGIGEFDVFFRASMKRTTESLRSAERKHRIGEQKIRGLGKALPLSRQFQSGIDTHFLTPQPDKRELAEKQVDEIALSADQFKRALATAIVRKRMGATLRAYAERLPRYSELKMTTKEIADDLGVKSGSIDPYRKRLRDALKGPDSK